MARDQLAWLDQLVPLSIAWHDGHKLKLLYAEKAASKTCEPNPPELQIKLIECFALKEHSRTVWLQKVKLQSRWIGRKKVQKAWKYGGKI